MNAPLKNVRQPPLSPLHAMLATVEHETHPHHLNRLLSDPSIEPWVRGYAIGKLDASRLLEDPSIIVLGGKFAACVLRQVMPGLYDLHVQCVPEGRGKWMLDFSRAAFHWLFCRTDCMEIMGRLPTGNLPVKAYARSLGFRHRFTSQKGWVKDLDPLPCDIVSICLHDWVAAAPGLVERGHWVAEHLQVSWVQEEERFIGLAMEMLLSGQTQVMKAVVWHNRWADMAGFPIMQILTLDPLAVILAGTQIIVRPQSQDFWVVAAK